MAQCIYTAKDNLPCSLCSLHSGSSASEHLLFAAQNGNIDLVRKVITNNISIEDGNKALLLAAQNGHFKIIETLSELKIDNNFAKSALRKAARNGHTQVCENILLWFVDVNPNSANQAGNTALHIAVRKENLPLVNLLLEDFAIQIDIKNQKGQTPLSIASCKGFESIRQRLEEKREAMIRDHKRRRKLKASEIYPRR
jgi:ankyrin repeat protein